MQSGIPIALSRSMVFSSLYYCSVLSVGILDGYFTMFKCKQITAGDFNFGPISFCSRECPFCQTPVPGNNMPWVGPLSIRECVKDIFKCFSHSQLSDEFLSVCFRACGCLKNTVFSHVGHNCVQVMRIKGIGKGL